MSNEITSTMDEPLSLCLSDQQDIERRVDEIIAESLRAKDPVIVLNGIARIEGFIRISGLGLAKALWELSSNWDVFEIDEEFTDFVQEHTSISKATIKRYVTTWEMYHNKSVPKKFQEQIKGRTMRDQVEIAKIADRVEMSDKDWNTIASTANGHELQEVKRKLLKLKPRKSGVVIRLRRNGDIEAYDSEKKRHYIGNLEIDEAKNDPIVAKAIGRIIRGAAILEE